MRNKHQTILFIDLDETIIRNPFETAIFPLVSSMISEETDLPSELIKKMLLSENERRKNDDTIAPALVFDWDDIVKTVTKKLNVELSVSIEKLVSEYSHAPYISLLNKSVFCLDQIRKPHRRIIAATNGLLKYQAPVLHALKIYHLFDGFLAPDVRNALKGDRDFYGDMLIDSVSAISVGDSYEYDIVRPKHLGMITVWLQTSMDTKLKKLSPFERVPTYFLIQHETVRPDAIIYSLSELDFVVSRIEDQ